MGRKSRYIQISVNQKGKLNPIYKKIEDYIIQTKIENLRLCNIVPQKGELCFDLSDATFHKEIENVYKNHKIYLCFTGDYEATRETTKDDPQGTKKVAQTILVYSHTASMEELREFISYLAKLEKKKSNMMTVYRVISSTKEGNPDWDCLKFHSNKTEFNTIVSAKVKSELFDDIELFMNSENLYAERGLDFKRGYMLYGPPGCGKSSSIKAIANKYSLPVFNLDLETIKTNSHLISLMNDILYEVPDSPYILTIEDFDRHEMFLNKVKYAKRKDKVTMQCLLNVIDGIVETHGRILFITCNDKQNVEKVDALIRPGRIDRAIELDYCDSDQATRLINNYFKTVITIENTRPKVTPAELIKKMQTSQSLEETTKYISNIPNVSVAADEVIIKEPARKRRRR